MNLVYEAIDEHGKRVKGEIDATGTPEAVTSLKGRGLTPTRIQEARGGHEGRIGSAARVKPANRLSLRMLVLLTRQLAMLMQAGSGVYEAIQAVARQMKPRQAAMLGTVAANLQEGVSLAEALRKHPSTFNPVYCAIIAAGEASATLGQMFHRLAAMLGKQRALRNKVLGSLAYPAVLIGLCIKIILVLMFFVLPRFAGMFQQLGVQTPAVTRWLLATGEMLRDHWVVFAMMTLLFAGATAWMVTQDQGRRWISEAAMRIPVIGRIRTRLMLAQVLRTFGMLLESQVGVLESMQLVRASSWTSSIQRLFRLMDEAITSGGQLSTAFSDSKLVDAYICQAIHTGEESGKLGESMTYCADVLDENNTELVNTLARLIEPAILISMGVVVGGVAIALFLPLFDLTSAIK